MKPEVERARLRPIVRSALVATLIVAAFVGTSRLTAPEYPTLTEADVTWTSDVNYQFPTGIGSLGNTEIRLNAEVGTLNLFEYDVITVNTPTRLP